MMNPVPVACLVFVAAWCSLFLMPATEAATVNRTFRARFAYLSETSDLGWTWRHNLGLVLMHRSLTEAHPDMTIDAKYLEFVPEGCDPCFDTWGKEGHDMIVGTSFGYMDCMIAAAAKYPNSSFLHISGYKMGTSNFALGYCRMYQPNYLAGYTAGLMTTTNVICLVGPYNIPETYRQLSAWTIGARRANPNVTVHVVWTYSWYDPPAESWVVRQLHRLNCDVVCVRADAVDGYKTASSLGMYSTGFNSDHRMIVGESVLVSAYFNWGALYDMVAELILNGTFASSKRDWFLGWDVNAVGITEFSFYVPSATAAKVKQEQARIFNVTSGPDKIFCGPIYDKDGVTLRVNASTCMTDGEMLSMMWLPQGAVDHGQWVLPGRKCAGGEYGDWDIVHETLTCRKCPAGTVSYNKDADSYCTACPIGYYSTVGSVNCTMCPPGTYGESANVSACTPCPKGTQTPQQGSTNCKACPKDQEPDSTQTTCQPLPGPAPLWIIPVVVILVVVISALAMIPLWFRYQHKRQRERAIAAAPQGEVTLVFTDVQDSTNIWDTMPDVMKEALDLHNAIFRNLITQHEGYEVKTEGDAFMIAFWTPDAALEFCMDAQEELVGAKWPEELLTYSSCKPVASTVDPKANIFCGLRVRMGIHTGYPDVEFNPETLKADYFGPMVNCAARVSSLGAGGQCMISRDAADALNMPNHPDVILTPLGPFKLKGISDEKEVLQVITFNLKERTYPPINKVSGLSSTSMEQKKGIQTCEKCSRPIKCPHCEKEAKAKRKGGDGSRRESVLTSARRLMETASFASSARRVASPHGSNHV